jgi:hypothetical protein
LKSKKRYDKELIEIECLKSKKNGRITDPLGVFILDRCREIAESSFNNPRNEELCQVLIDEAVMRICEKFLEYYEEGKSGANLIITMAISTIINKLKSLNWSDMYGEKQKSYIIHFEDGVWVRRLEKLKRDDNISQKL